MYGSWLHESVPIYWWLELKHSSVFFGIQVGLKHIISTIFGGNCRVDELEAGNSVSKSTVDFSLCLTNTGPGNEDPPVVF